MSPQKLFICYHLPTRGRAGVKLGDADTFVLSSLIPAHNAYIYGQDCVCACHLKNYFFVISYLLEDEQELSLGMLIHLKRIFNF
jgi:hypothetical protein